MHRPFDKPRCRSDRIAQPKPQTEAGCFSQKQENYPVHKQNQKVKIYSHILHTLRKLIHRQSEGILFEKLLFLAPRID